MRKLKLIKGASYYNGIIKATKEQPYVNVSDLEAENLVDTGYFAVCEDNTSEADLAESTQDSAPDYKALSRMSKAELSEYAEENGIATDRCKTKADLLEVISVANGGSATMIELQKK